MAEKGTLYHCLNCNQSEADIPLVAVRFAKNQTWICTQCLPILIHQPQQLVGKLANAEQVPSTSPPASIHKNR